MDHCLALVELARREFKSVRAVGRAHSPSDLMMTGNWAIRMQDLQGVLEVSEGLEFKRVVQKDWSFQGWWR